MIVFCGIAIILAVALNIVNGFTGQFSLGHIGFYMVGAYVAAAICHLRPRRLFPACRPTARPVSVGPARLSRSWCCAWPGGLAPPLIGFLVGLPSLRLRGDYLAIITLGFAQIIQVVIRNIKAVDGATTFNGHHARRRPTIAIPHLTSLFWVYLVAALSSVGVLRPALLHPRPRFLGRA